jgi:hypothetical protein
MRVTTMQHALSHAHSCSHVEHLQPRAAGSQAQQADVGECAAVAQVDVLQLDGFVACKRVVSNLGAVLERQYMQGIPHQTLLKQGSRHTRALHGKPLTCSKGQCMHTRCTSAEVTEVMPLSVSSIKCCETRKDMAKGEMD